MAISLFVSGLAEAQNLDLFSGKEFDDMSKLNPAFTGFLEEFRLLTGRSDQLRAGIESKFFKTPNYFGANFEMDEIEHLKRQSFQFSYAREKEIKERFVLKYAASLDYQVRTFFRNEADSSFTFSDFNGNNWFYDSRTSAIRVRSEVFDLGAGLAAVYKNLILGVNAKHIGGMVLDLYEDSSSVTIPVEINAQLAGFIELGPELRLFPNLIYAQVGDQTWLASGLGITKGDWSLSAQYEISEELKRIDISLFGRVNRFLIGIGYLRDDPSPAGDLLLIDQIRLTLNTTLLGKKKRDLDSFIGKMKSYY
ncbi:MAG: type IX secretion system membrane protein PorP/SprF [Flavobacteriales bacterium]|nr:type IX secretion system membrane protein PorP/SprF [Flavobacteriales bacterium]